MLHEQYTGFRRIKSNLVNTILLFQPDESTGADYEQIERKYDSEEEFEII